MWGNHIGARCSPPGATALGLACLAIINPPAPTSGFFRPPAKVNTPASGTRPRGALPQLRDRERVKPWIIMSGADQGNGKWQPEEGSAGATAAEGSAGTETGAATESTDGSAGDDVVEGRAEGDGHDDFVSLPPLEVPEMTMTEEERIKLWVAVSRVEVEASRLERLGQKEEAASLRVRADAMRHEDPYTTLQEQLDEAVAKEEFVKVARLRLQMSRIGVPPNAEMQAKAEGRDASTVAQKAAKQMPGMTGREGERNAQESGRAGSAGASDGYSSKSVTTTHGIRVEVRSQYYPEQSNPLKDQYIFVYKVKITNQSSQTVQLVSRTWEIKAVQATEAPQLVKGPGVVGQQPVLEPGQSFEYSSACPITCAPKEGYQVLGRMKGSYLIVLGSVGEAAFEAKIDPFYLILPQAVLDERSGGGGSGTGGGDMAGSW